MGDHDETTTNFSQLADVAEEANRRADSLQQRTWDAEEALRTAERALEVLRQKAIAYLDALYLGAPSDVRQRTVDELGDAAGWERPSADPFSPDAVAGTGFAPVGGTGDRA